MPILLGDSGPDEPSGGFVTLGQTANPPGLQGPVGKPSVLDLNTFHQFVVGLNQGAARELRRSERARAAIRRGRR